jgi:hypothetical protein
MLPMSMDSTPFNFTFEFEDKGEAEELNRLFGDSYNDVTSYLNGILIEVDQRIVNELFMKISQL